MCLQCAVFEFNNFYVEFVTLLIENSLKLGINLKTFVLLALEGIFVTIVFYVNRMNGSRLQMIIGMSKFPWGMAHQVTSIGQAFPLN